MGVFNCSMFCCTLLYVHSSIAIFLMGKRELIALLNLSSWCLVMVKRLFLVVPRGCDCGISWSYSLTVLEGCVTQMLEDLKLQILQQRRLDTRLVMLYTCVSGMVPAINADEFFLLSGIRHVNTIPIWLYAISSVVSFSINHTEWSKYQIPIQTKPEFIFFRTISRWKEME